MSLDVSLYELSYPEERDSGKILVYQDGRPLFLTEEEWEFAYPGEALPPTAQNYPSLHEVFEANITHNLIGMAKEAGLYGAVWRPEENGFTRAEQLILPLEEGLQRLREDPERFKAFDLTIGGSKYKDFVPWIERYLQACKSYPQTRISAG